MMDIYRDFAELSKHEREGIDYRIDMRDERSLVAIIAPHGGKIEPLTSEIAKKIADMGDYNYYLFEGCKSAGNHTLHITSTNFDEPTAIRLVEKSHMVVAIHGRANEDGSFFDQDVWIAGCHEDLKTLMQDYLGMAGFKSRLLRLSNTISGFSEHNICNKGLMRAGAELVLPRALRENLMRDRHRMERFCTAIHNAVREA